MLKTNLFGAFILLSGMMSPWGAGAEEVLKDYPIQSVPFTSVRVQSEFWTPRMETNRVVTIPHNLRELEKQGSLGGFEFLAGKTTNQYHGYLWGDSDVYKTIEGIAYSLQTHPDAELEKRMEDLVDSIVRAQAPDGYLFPHLQIKEPDYIHFTEEASRTAELYSMGHLIESAVVHHQATGRDPYLDAAINLADLIARVYAPGGIEAPSGTPEVELALVRLSRATKNRAYLDLASDLVRLAGQFPTRWSTGNYGTERPALAHDEALGHAVAMLYLYSGATDVAVLTCDHALFSRLERKWENLVGRKMYLIGNTGHRKHREGFPTDYDLPNRQFAYNETCAAIANVFWNHRMFLASGDAKYLDVVERALYNGVLAGIGLSGNRFFYDNPMESDGKHRRFEWHRCPCCPNNVIRFIPTVAGYGYATRANALYVNHFIGGSATVKLPATTVTLKQETRYPWDGAVKITVASDQAARFAMNVRIPGWARNEPVPSDLYRYEDSEKPEVKLAVNGKPVAVKLAKGFAVIDREWKSGDTVTLDLAMPVRRVVAHPAVTENVGKFAVERGPLVYCAEGADNEGKVLDKTPGGDARFEAQEQSDLFGGIVTIQARPHRDGDALTLIPYCLWANRGANEMAVWFASGTTAATARAGE